MEEIEDFLKTENLADLKHDSNIENAIEQRYAKQKIYTFAGQVLIALNTPKKLDIYDASTVEQYAKKGPFSGHAHIFSVASKALDRIKNGSENEVILFRGKTAAGKTKNAFHVTRFLSSVGGNDGITPKHISALETILGSLIGAKTQANDSSTRMSYKLDVLYFRQKLRGLNVSSMTPLELRRVVTQKPGERSFNVFYELCSGLDAKQKEEYGLQFAKNYFYLNAHKTNSETDNSDKVGFSEFKKALKTAGFSENHEQIVYRFLSAILHIGNIYFTVKLDAENKECVQVANENELQWIAHLLDVDSDVVEEVFTTHVIVNKENDSYDEKPPMMRENIRSVDKALDTRDLLAQTIYKQLIAWVLKEISLFYKPDEYDSKISILDTVGFTKNSVNHFEEFCFNIIDERLHNFCIQKLFKEPQADYEGEAVPCLYKFTPSFDNDKVFAMLFNRPTGIVHLLNDECRFPKSSDENFIQRSFLNHVNKSSFVMPKIKGRPEFGIRHYAGTVVYNVNGFLQSNHWTETNVISSILKQSNDPTLNYIFPPLEQENQILVLDEYVKSVQALIKFLQSKPLHIVCCIQAQSPDGDYNFVAVNKQLKSLTIQECCKFENQAYQNKLSFKSFIDQYDCLLPSITDPNNDPKQTVVDILNGQGKKFFNAYAVGSHSVYLKNVMFEHLNNAKVTLRDTSATIIQRNWKKHVVQNEFQKQKTAAVKIQANARGWLTRRKIKATGQKDKNNIENVLQEKNPSEQNADGHPVLPGWWFNKADQLEKILNEEDDAYVFKNSTKYISQNHHESLPITNDVTIEEFAHNYMKNHVLGVRREPIMSPFLNKDTESDYEQSLQLFRLILRYMNDATLTGSQRIGLAKFIIQQGIENRNLRDEIYIQLCNQTYDNKNKQNSKKAWDLLLMCVNTFPPGILVYPMLKNYFENQDEPLRTQLLQGMYRPLRHDENNRCRSFASIALEQEAFSRRQPFVLRIFLVTGEEFLVEVDSWTSADEIVERVFKLVGIPDITGWALDVNKVTSECSCAGQQLICDALSQFCMPASKNTGAFANFSVINEESICPSHQADYRESSSETSQGCSEDYPAVLNQRNVVMKQLSKHRPTPEEYAQMSVASRIRNMKIPAANGDVDKFLDEVFDQALPSTDDDAVQAISSSIKGGGSYNGCNFSRVRPMRRTETESSYYPEQNMHRQSSTTSNGSPYGTGSQNEYSECGSPNLFSNRSNVYPPSSQLTHYDSESAYSSNPPVAKHFHQTNDNAVLPQQMMYNDHVINDNYAPVGTSNSRIRRRFEQSPATQRRSRRSMSTPRGTSARNPSDVVIPAPDYDEVPKFTPTRRPKVRSTSVTRSVTPKSGYDAQLGNGFPPSVVRKPYVSNGHAASTDYFENDENASHDLSERSSVRSLVDSFSPLGHRRPESRASSRQSQFSGARLPPATSLADEPWKITIRREVFFPGEKLIDTTAVDLVFAQIISDCRKKAFQRIRQFERDRINCILNKHKLPVEALGCMEDIPMVVKNEVIAEARRWPHYFCRYYCVIDENTSTSLILSVGENGLRFMTRDTEKPHDAMITQQVIAFDDIQEILCDENSVKIITKQKTFGSLIAYNAPKIVDFISRFLDFIPKQKNFVVAIADYQTNEPDVLSFYKGDIIQLVDSHQSCKVSPFGNWLYGMIRNNFGSFPAEYVQQTNPVDVSSGIPSIASPLNNNTCDTGSKNDIYAAGNYQSENHYADWDNQNIYGVPQQSKLTTVEMAMRFFRPPKAGEFGTLPFKSKKQSWSWMEINDKVKFVDKPITQSLLRFDNLLSKLAVETFQCIMRYMNDYPLKRGQTITDCVYEVLSLCHTNMPLRDEVYCQIIKQTTANRSRRSDSLLRGWRLFTILTAFFAASDGLQPYLLKYLADIAGDQRRPFSGVAQVSLANYKQTQKFGGRKFILAAAEVEAITNGKNIKRQGFELPGGQKRVLNIKTITVVEEVITELCKEMNIWSCAEQHEFSICYILLKDNSLHVLSNDEYILDITSELESRDEDYTLLLMRTVWIHPLREDNQLYIDVLFFQIVPNYMTGLLTTLPEADKVSAKTLDDAAMAAALLHAARGGNAATLSKETVMSLVPQTVFHISGLSQSNWLKRVTQKLAKLPSDCLYSAARLEFIRFIEKWPLFGSSFYFVSGVIHENLNVTDAIISINKNCIKVLKNHTMTTLESFDLCDVQSSRKYVLGDKSYLDINIGFNNSTSGTILHIETSASEEIARTIGQYIYLMSANRQDPITVFTNQNNNYSCA